MRLFVFGLIVLVTSVFSCTVRADEWTGPDKVLHLGAGGAISLLATGVTGSAGMGAAAGCSVGVLKEISDTQTRWHHPSIKDALATCAGAGLVSFTGVAVYPDRITWTMKF